MFDRLLGHKLLISNEGSLLCGRLVVTKYEAGVTIEPNVKSCWSTHVGAKCTVNDLPFSTEVQICTKSFGSNTFELLDCHRRLLDTSFGVGSIVWEDANGPSATLSLLYFHLTKNITNLFEYFRSVHIFIFIITKPTSPK